MKIIDAFREFFGQPLRSDSVIRIYDNEGELIYCSSEDAKQQRLRIASLLDAAGRSINDDELKRLMQESGFVNDAHSPYDLSLSAEVMFRAAADNTLADRIDEIGRRARRGRLIAWMFGAIYAVGLVAALMH